MKEFVKTEKKIFFSWNARTFFDSSGSVTEIVFEGNDITELEKTRHALEEKTKLFDTLLNFIPEGIIITDRDQVIQAASRYTEELLGQPLNKMVYKNERGVLDELPLFWPDGETKPSTNELPLSKVAIQKGVPTSYELLLKNNGLSKTISYNAAPVLDENGTVTGAIGNLRDTTETSKLLKENINQKYLLERIVNNSPFVIALFTVPECRFVFVNTEYEKISRGKENPVGKLLSEVWPLGQNVYNKHFQQIIDSPEVTRFEDIPFDVIRDRGPEKIYTSSTFVPIFTADHKLENILVILEETTESVHNRKMVHEIYARDEAILASLTDGVMVHDIKGKLTYMNPVAKVLHDVPDETYTNISFEMLDYSRKRLPLSQWPYSKALRGERFTGYETIVVNKHTNREWFASYNGSPVYNDKGELIFAVISAHDITARKKAEEQLQAAQLKLQKFVDSDIVGIVVATEQGDLIEVNDYYLNLIGYTREEITTKKVKWTEITPPEFLKSDYEAFRQLKEKGQCTPYQKQYYRKDGSLVWALLGLVSLDKNNFLSFIIDISNQKKAEDAVRKSEAQLRSVFNSVNEGIIVFDSTGEILVANKAQREITEFEDSGSFEQNKKSFSENHLLFNLDGSALAQSDWPYARVLRGESFKDLELYGQKKGFNDKRFFGFSGEPLFDDSGKQILAVLITRDITFRKNAENLIKESEQRFRGIFELSPVGVTSVDLQSGKFLLANEQFSKITGYSNEELLDLTYTDLTYPQDRESDRIKFENMAQGKTAEYNSEKRYVRKNGQIIWVRITAKTWYKSTEKITPTIGIVQDITERKNTEMKLLESEELFRNLADNISQHVWMADPNGHLFWFNKRWFEFTGATLEQIQQGCKLIQHPDYFDKVMSKIKHSYDTGEPWEDTFPLLGTDGHYRWFLSRAVPVRNDKGIIIRWIGTNTDITEARERQSKIEEQKRTLETILEFIPQGLVVASPDGKVTHASKFDRAYTGIPANSADEDKTRITSMRLRKPGKEPVQFNQIPLFKALKGEQIFNEEWEINAVDGSIIQALMSAVPIKDEKEKIIGAVLAWRDISDLVQQRKTLELQKKALQKAECEAQKGQANAELRTREIEQEKRVLDTLIEHVPAGVVIVDKSGKIRNVSSYLSRLLNVPKERLIGTQEDPLAWGLLDPHTHRTPDYQSLPVVRAMQEKLAISDIEYLLKTDDQIMTVAQSAVPVIDKNGEVSGGVSVWNDITERKHIEQEKTYQAARYQAVFNSISEGLIIADKNGVVREVNPATAQTYPMIPELMNRKVTDMEEILTMYDSHDQKLPIDIWPVNRVIRGENLENYQIRIKFKNGTNRYLLVSGSPVIIDSKTPLVVILFRDITMQIETEKKLRAALYKIQSFINANVIGIVTGNLKGEITDSNDYYLNLAGFSREEMNEGKINWKKLSPPEYLNKDKAASEEINKLGSCSPYEKELFRKDGSRIWVTIAIAATVRDEIIAFILDVSDRKRLEKQLRDERNFISAILSTQGAMVGIIDVFGTVIDLNPAFQEITGFSLNEMKGKSFWRFFPEEDFKKVINQYKTVKNSYEPVVIENWIQSKDGKKHFVRWRNSVLRNDNGDITHIIATGLDITDRLETEEKIKKLNDDLNQHAAELENVNSELETFSYSVSHDLRSPLAIIDGFNQLILDDYSSQFDPEIVGYLLNIQNSTKKMKTLINDLLTLSSITRSDMAVEEINLSELVSTYLEEIHASEPERKTVFTVQKGVVVQADLRLLHLAIENMLSNSWKYCSKKEVTEIQFGSIVKDNAIVYFIKDNGIGFDMKYAASIFQPFKRLHAEREFKGTGIGLATVVRVIRRLNGQIWADAEVGKGATFYFTLNPIV